MALPEKDTEAMKAARVHLRISKPPMRAGQPHVVTNDRIVAVAEDGTEVDISSCVTEWREISKVGEARRVEIVLFGFHITEQDGSEVYASREDAAEAVAR
jgi:hypothetical protein